MNGDILAIKIKGQIFKFRSNHPVGPHKRVSTTMPLSPQLFLLRVVCSLVLKISF